MDFHITATTEAHGIATGLGNIGKEMDDEQKVYPIFTHGSANILDLFGNFKIRNIIYDY